MKNLMFVGVAVAAVVAASAAGAADVRMPIKTPPRPAPATQSWQGCYVGGHGGLGSSHTTWRDSPANNGQIDNTFLGQAANTDMSGAIYGAQVGCDFPVDGGLVFGLQGSWSQSTITGTNMDQFNSTWTLRAKVDSIVTATGRVGLTLDRSLIYARGGLAWARGKFEIENTSVFLGSPSVTNAGWVVGGGVEWGFAPNWTVFIEADHFDLGTKGLFFPGAPANPLVLNPAFLVNAGQKVETLKFGANYRFGSLPGLHF